MTDGSASDPVRSSLATAGTLTPVRAFSPPRAWLGLPGRMSAWTHAFLGLLALALVLRFAAIVLVPLIPEEAYYWMYAQHPNLSYYDHPPMVAWVIATGTWIFGSTELGVRIMGHVLMMGASVLLYVYGRIWFGRAPALMSALALQLLPAYFAVGFIATMDSALLFFWMVCLLGVTWALRDGRAWGWYVAGFGLGAAMLTKYTGVFLAVGAVLAVVAHAPWRRHLRTPHPYLAVLLAAILFSPVLLWNAHHDWASFRFQLVGRFARESFDLRQVLIFLAYQVLIATPLVLCVIFLLCARGARRPSRLLAPRWLMTLCFSLPPMAVMAYKSFTSEIHVNWTFPLYLTLLPAVSHWLVIQLRQPGDTLRHRRAAGGIAWTAFAGVFLNVGFMLYLLALQPRLQGIAAFGPWQQLADLVGQHEDRLERETGREPLVIAGGKYRLASVLAFYRSPVEGASTASRYTTSRWIVSGRSGLAFPYWTTPERWLGIDCIYVTDDEDHKVVKELRPLFDSVELVDDPRLKGLGNVDYRLAICRGLRRLPASVSAGGRDLSAPR